jgi:hypothetical protein
LSTHPQRVTTSPTSASRRSPAACDRDGHESSSERKDSDAAATSAASAFAATAVVELARVPRRSAGERLEACGAGARRGAAEGSVAAEDIDIDIDIGVVVVVARVERDSASGARARFVGARGTTWTSARA